MVDDDGHVMLCADAQKNDGSYRRQSIRIDKKFENIDGVLIYSTWVFVVLTHFA